MAIVREDHKEDVETAVSTSEKEPRFPNQSGLAADEGITNEPAGHHDSVSTTSILKITGVKIPVGLKRNEVVGKDRSHGVSGNVL